MKSPQLQQAVILSDSHVTYHDPAAHSIALQVIKAIQPHTVVHLGDLLDCYSISSFSKSPERLETLQDEINVATSLLQQITKAAPKAERYLLLGNHEDRLKKIINNLSNEARQLALLDNFKSSLRWDSLLDLHSLGWHLVPTEKQPMPGIIPGMLLKHGTVVRKYSGYSAKGEFDALHASTISGHTHRMAVVHHRDYNGHHTSIENGCLCKLDADYIQGIANWQQGFTVLSWQKGSKDLPQVEQVRIEDGTAMFRGNVYNGQNR